MATQETEHSDDPLTLWKGFCQDRYGQSAGAAAERDVRDAVFGLARELLGQTFGRRDDHGDRLQIDGNRYHQVAASSNQAMTVFGAVTFPRARDRHRHRPSGTGPSRTLRGARGAGSGFDPGGMTGA